MSTHSLFAFLEFRRFEFRGIEEPNPTAGVNSAAAREGGNVAPHLTLVEAPLLLDRRDRHGLRALALAKVTDRYTRDELQRLHELSLDERRRPRGCRRDRTAPPPATTTTYPPHRW